MQPVSDVTDFAPVYLRLLGNGELARRAEQAWRHLTRCDLCPRYCRVGRYHGISGAVCRTGEQAVVASYGAHHGEEDCLRGRRGSGTIFFSWCNLRCVYCQNWHVSQRGNGREVAPAEIADMMLELQEEGCHNVNLVTPSHVVAQILAALHDAAGRGLRLPIVYNTGGYDSPEALALLDGVIDIYMPDMKYGDPELARRYSRVRDYVQVNQAAVREMHRQVGDLVIDGDGIARRGLLVRHLVLPDGAASTDRVLGFLADEISRDTYINLMDQYRPCYRADECPEIDRPITGDEYRRAVVAAGRLGLDRLDGRAAMRSRLQRGPARP
jgi:putative pyruvate formate lyase activating enzyme